MHKSRFVALVIDCENADLDAASRFWSGALGKKVKATEGSYVTLLAMFAVDAPTALAFSLVCRARDVMTGAPVVLAWQFMERGRRIERSAQPASGAGDGSPSHCKVPAHHVEHVVASQVSGDGSGVLLHQHARSAGTGSDRIVKLNEAALSGDV